MEYVTTVSSHRDDLDLSKMGKVVKLLGLVRCIAVKDDDPLLIVAWRRLVDEEPDSIVGASFRRRSYEPIRGR